MGDAIKVEDEDKGHVLQAEGLLASVASLMSERDDVDTDYIYNGACMTTLGIDKHNKRIIWETWGNCDLCELRKVLA